MEGMDGGKGENGVMQTFRNDCRLNDVSKLDCVGDGTRVCTLFAGV